MPRGLRAIPLVPLSAICSLAAHAAVYRSFFPSGSAHRYLAWYEPFVGGLSVAAVALLTGAAALAASGRALPWRLGTRGLWSRLCAGGVLLFLLQESLERSLSGGGAGVAALSAGTWLAVLAAVAAFAALIVLAARSGAALVRLARRRLARPRSRRELPGRPQLPAAPRRRPLADRRALRAPPLLAG